MACSFFPFCLGMCEWTECAWNSALGESSTSSSVGGPTSAQSLLVFWSSWVTTNFSCSAMCLFQRTQVRIPSGPWILLKRVEKCSQQPRPLTRRLVYMHWPWCSRPKCPSFFVTASFELHCIYIHIAFYYSIIDHDHNLELQLILSYIELWTACACRHSLPQGEKYNHKHPVVTLREGNMAHTLPPLLWH